MNADVSSIVKRIASHYPRRPAKARSWPLRGRAARRNAVPLRLGVERLCERVLLSAVPYAAEPALVQQANASDAALDDRLAFGDTSTTRNVTGSIDPSTPRESREIRIEQTGRLIVDMKALAATDAALNGTLDSMLWLYDEHGFLLVNNDDVAVGDPSARIAQRLTAGTYRLEMSASPAAGDGGAVGGFSVDTQWQPTADISVATIRIEGGAEGAVVVDLDGDGHLDIASVNDDNEVNVYYGVGDGSFRERVVVGAVKGSASRRIVAGNFDGEGGLDLAVALDIDRELVLFTNDAAGEWRVAGGPFLIDNEPDRLAVGDFNGDGIDDLVLPTRGESQWLFYGDSQSPFSLNSSQSLVGSDGEQIIDASRAATVGDFNGDGRDDIAIAFKTPSNVQVWINEGVDPSAGGRVGMARFRPSDLVPMGIETIESSGTEGIVAADMNGDGLLDLAAVNDKSDTVSIRLGRGDGTFAHTGGDFQVGVDSESLGVADFNGDGVPDVVATNEDTHSISVLIGIAGADRKGTGEFLPRQIYPAGFRPTDVAVGDLNEDGNVDIAVKLDGGGLSFFFGLGDGTFLAADSTTVGDDPDAIVAADFNADGFLDVAVANLPSAEVSVLLGRGDGGFAPQIRYPLAERAYPHAIAVGDINDDGRPDLVTANEGTDDVSILLGLGNGQFRPHAATFAVGDSPWAVVVEDFDGDGRMDIATANRKDNGVAVLFGKKGVVDLAFDRVEYSTGAGKLPEALFVKKNAFGRVVSLATANRLTRDFSVFAFTPSTRAWSEPVVASRADFVSSEELPQWLKTDRAMPRPPDANGNPDASPARYMPRLVTTADFNNDGNDDIVMIDDRTHSAWMLLGHGDGAFLPPIQFPIYTDPEYVVAKDLDADGNVDIVTGQDTDNLVFVHYGRGDGTFENGKEYAAADGPERVIIEDFTGDGRLDIAIANDDDKKLVLWKQTSDREFEHVDDPIAADGSGSVPNFYSGSAAGRFAGDGHLDLASFDRGLAQAVVHIFAGNGDGTFAPVQSIPLGIEGETTTSKAEFIVAGDLDRDGDDDIVVPDISSNRVWILWNDAGTFVADHRDFGRENISGAADLDIRQAVLGHFDGNEFLDIAVVNKLDNSISILYGDIRNRADRGNAYAVAEAATLQVGVHPGTLATADFNNDGRSDLVVGNRGSYDLSVLLGLGGGEFEREDRIGRTAGDAPAVRGDFNRDGYEDRITTRDVDNDLLIELGNGSNVDSDGRGDLVLASKGARAAIVNPLVADLDNDGMDDIVTLSYRGEILVRFREMSANGDDSLIRYAPPQVVNPGSPARDIALVRAVDGWQIAAAELMDDTHGPQGHTGRVGIHRLVDGRFERTVLSTASGAAILTTGDLDGDGGDELVVYSALAGEINVFRQDSQSEWAKAGASIVAGPTVADIALANVAGGEKSGQDLIVTNRAAGMVMVFVGNGDATFTSSPQIAARAGEEAKWPYGYDPATQSVVSVHGTATTLIDLIDGDDSPDFVIVNQATNSVAVLLGKDRQTLSAPLPIALDGSPVSATTGDVNGDALADLVLVYSSGEAAILLRNDDGGFHPVERDGGSYTARVGRDAVGVRLVQADSDGVADLAIANRFGDVLTLLGNGDGTFREFRRADLSLFLVVEDIDGDGTGDYIFTNESRDRIEVRNSSAADFAQDADDGLLAPGKAVVADLNADGILDFAVPNFGGNSVIVYVGIAPGKFAAGRSFPVGGNPSHASEADVNGDGIADLVVANAGSNDVVVLYGQGRGDAWTFDPGLRLSAGQGPVHTMVADATDDGVLDIVVTNEREDSVFVLPGRGGGFFDDRQDSRTEFNLLSDSGSLGRGPIQSFLSGSGLATINRDSNNLTFFAGMNRNFGSSIPTFGLRPVSAVLGDFNFDRQLELVVAHELDGMFSVFSADADGFTLLRTQQFAGLSHPSDLAVWDDHGRVSVFGVGDGRETAVVLFSAVPDNGFDVVREESGAHTDFIAGFGDSYLPYIVGLISGIEVGGVGILIVPGEEDDSLLDDGSGDSQSTSRDDAQRQAARLLSECADDLWAWEDDEFDAEESSDAPALQPPITGLAQPTPNEEAQGERERISSHDVFFRYLEDTAQAISAAYREHDDALPVGQDTEHVDSTQPGDLPPSEKVNRVESARFEKDVDKRFDESRRKQGDVPRRRKEITPNAPASGAIHPSAAAVPMLFVGLPGWTRLSETRLRSSKRRSIAFRKRTVLQNRRRPPVT